MELVQKNIHFNRIAKEARNQITIEEDVNIPDTKEDIEDILCSNHSVMIEDVKTGEQKVHIRGKLRYSVLYKSEETGDLCSLMGSIPIDEQLYLEDVSGADRVMVRPQVDDFSVGMINSRKISIQSIVELYAYVQELYDEQITIGVDKVECESCQKECDFTQLAVCKKDLFRFRENITIPNNMPNVEDVVFSCVKVSDIEYKPMDGQLSVQGKVQVFVIYDGERDCRNQVYQATVPFGAMMECSGSNMNMVSQICYDVVDSQVHLETDFDGEARSFSVELVLELDIKLYEQQKVNVLWDLYGLQKELKPDVRSMDYQVLAGQYMGKIKATDKINMPVNEDIRAKVVYSQGNALLEKCEMTDEGMMIKGVVVCQVLYAAGMEEEEYGCIHFTLPFMKTVEETEVFANKKMQSSVCIQCPDLQISFDMEGNMDALAGISYNLLLFENITGRNITNVDVYEMDMEKCNDLPSMAICFVSKNDTLWEMGKKYGVPLGQIREVNQLSNNEIKEGDKILIVRGMCS
ncbi:MAG: DUF3794 domain-containing protein [Lachnospiraceae bacterium]|nr:DUF3794 domain-containing protein [Lachnospiraceae bacterium]